MKNYVFLVVWFFSTFCSGLDQYGQYIGNPDDMAKIERPCPTYDLNCIREYFDTHSHCRKTFGSVPDPITRPQSNFYIPRANFSVSVPMERVGGLNGRVEEFYINRETNNLVIAVAFQNVNINSDNFYFIFHRRAKEPVATRAFATININSFTTTAVIPKADNFKLQEAECTTFSNDPISEFILDPSAALSSDPQSASGTAEFVTNLSNDLQEFFLTDSTFFITTYIQYNICDYGIIVS